MMGNMPIAYQLKSQDFTAYRATRSPLAESRYIQQASCCGSSGVGQMITWFDTSHQQSDEQTQHDCNFDISTWSQHIRVY